jgi:hypothetical protein
MRTDEKTAFRLVALSLLSLPTLIALTGLVAT